MKSAQIREAFLKFFADQGHQVVNSSPLIPANDPTLLFTNAGMVQFKETFLGKESRDYVRATSSQRVVRAGGKHNDLENVGYTARHHTFFEMLGNFSFGDYFKHEAIHFAWEFLTKVLQLPAEKLWVTVYKDDQEAEKIWFDEIGIDQNRFSRLGEKDNFWSMGDTGPCGPCTEIFYDHGPDVAGGPPGTPEEDGDRYIEIWNLVFMQYDRQPDGKLNPLPKPSVDTGMGLERISAVMQSVHNNYDIDLFKDLIHSIKGILTSAGATTDFDADGQQQSLRVIADHIRACSFLIVDGVVPSNEGRGYVLRRIIRRAVRHGNKLGATQSFFHYCVEPLSELMGDAYPELLQALDKVKQLLAREEQKFAETLEQGLRILEADLNKLTGTIIPGQTIFTLYDTYGFPVDLTADIARERQLTLDMDGFDQAMAQQKQRSRDADQFANEYHSGFALDLETEFTGYDHLQSTSEIQHLFKDAEACRELKAGDAGILVSPLTAFYAESGGQVGDIGEIVTDSGRFLVSNTTKDQQAFLHHGKVESGEIKVAQSATFLVDSQVRAATVLNHSATHLLHAALRKLLGAHVTQKGSMVDNKRLRFDFSNLEPLTQTQLRQIETLVNHQIRANTAVETELMSMEEAQSKGAMALFGEKYGAQVRVLSMGEEDFSIELCGGTHVARTGDIGLFKIVSENGVAAGVRRIEAVTGEAALELVNDLQDDLSKVGQLVKTGRDKLVSRVEHLVVEQKRLDKEVAKLKEKAAVSQGGELSDKSEQVGDIQLLVHAFGELDAKSLRNTADQLKNKLGKAVVVLAALNGEKVQLVAGVTKAESGRIKAGELVGYVAKQVGGKGGGRPDMAMAGGTQPEAIKEALASVKPWVEEKLGINKA